jgi:5-methylcytosine-specific restriction protein A
MSWEGSTRASRLPANWKALREVVLDRDGHRCTCCGSSLRLQVDHVQPGDDHSLGNLATLCAACHLRKSAAEGGRARAEKHSARRPPERHPGLK